MSFIFKTRPTMKRKAFVNQLVDDGFDPNAARDAWHSRVVEVCSDKDSDSITIEAEYPSGKVTLTAFPLKRNVADPAQQGQSTATEATRGAR